MSQPALAPAMVLVSSSVLGLNCHLLWVYDWEGGGYVAAGVWDTSGGLWLREGGRMVPGKGVYV